MHSASADNLAAWLLSRLELKSTVFHVGQYCGTWQASTAGRHLASFHVVLYGTCWLHIAATPEAAAESIRLGPGDAAFLPRDIPHCLSPDPVPPAPDRASARAGAMSPLDHQALDAGDSKASGIGIACGFFEFGSALDGLLVSLLPHRIVARHDHPSLAHTRAIFELIRDEARQAADAPSPVLAQLTSLLFLYALRAPGQGAQAVPSLWALVRHTAFAPLASAIVEEPARAWTTQTMASFANMSRSRFCKLFAELSGQPPAQFVALVRMKLAAEMLAHGHSMAQAAERVGYQSESAFAQAFRRVTGIQPGAWRRGCTTTAALAV